MPTHLTASADLLARWTALVDHPDGAPAGRDLLTRWAEPHRRYHDLDHLRAVLDRVDELAAEAADVDAVRLAAFFHDAVYEPLSSANEDRSAELAVRVLTALGVKPARIRTVERLVRGTAAHLAAGGDGDAAVLYDADLAVLAGDPAAYAAYAAAVRAEYAAVPDELFRAGRAEVLGQLIERPRLFATEIGYGQWEERARRNMAAELTLLQASG